MSFVTETNLIEQIVEREVSVLVLQLNHWPGLSQHQYNTQIQEKAAACRRLWQTKSAAELEKQLELMRINDTEIIASAIG